MRLKHHTLTSIYVILMFSLYLFFTGFSGYTSVFTAKAFMFFILGGVYAVLYFIIAFPKGRLTLSEIFAIIYLVITAVSAFASEYFPTTLVGASRREGLLTIFMYVCVFILVSRSWKAPKNFELILSVLMALQSVVVLLQLCDLNVLWLFPKGEYYSLAIEKYNGEFISTIGNADVASAFFSLMTPIVILFALFLKKKRFVHIIAAVLSLSALILMDVDAGVASLAACALISPLLFVPNKRAAVIIVCSMLLLGLAVLYFVPFESGTLYEINQIMHGNIDPAFGSARIYIWQNVLEKLEWLLGTGPDTMLLAGIDPFVKFFGETKVTMRIDIAHNDYLNILFHQGVFALAAYLAMLVTLLFKWFKMCRENIVVTVFGFGIISYLVHMFFSFSACSAAVFFWIIMGIVNSEAQK